VQDTEAPAEPESATQRVELLIVLTIFSSEHSTLILAAMASQVVLYQAKPTLVEDSAIEDSNKQDLNSNKGFNSKDLEHQPKLDSHRHRQRRVVRVPEAAEEALEQGSGFSTHRRQ